MQKWLSFIKAGSRKSNDNKRANPRLDVYHLAKYKLVSDPEDRSPTIAHIKNISGGGICLHAKEAIPVSEVILIAINVPGINQPVSSMAKICWTKKSGRSGGYEYGLKFLKMDEMLGRSIDGKIERIRRKIREEESG